MLDRQAGCARLPDHTNGAELPRLLTAEQVAARWQVPPAQVYRLAREGKLPTVYLGRYRRWRLGDLEQFEREGGADA